MAMAEEDWDATEQGRAYRNLRIYTESLGMVFVGNEVGGFITQGIEMLGKWAADNPQPSSKPLKQESIDLIRRMDTKHQESLRNSLIVIAACGSFEACIEDVVKGTITDDGTLLAGTKMSAEHIKQKHSITDPEEVLDRQWRALQLRPSPKLDACQRFQEVLELVGLKGEVPPLIAHTFNTAYAIRNVWAHNAGVADHSFFSRVSQEEIVIGDRVNVDRNTAAVYLSAIILYAAVILNRHRAFHQLGPIPNPGKPGETPLGQAYSALYQ